MSRPKSKEMDLTVGNPFWSLLKFAIPVILGNLFQLFYTLADSVIVGKTRCYQYHYLFCILFYQWIHGWIRDLSWSEMRCKRRKRYEKKCRRIHTSQYYFYDRADSDLLSAGSPDPQMDADPGRYLRGSL